MFGYIPRVGREYRNAWIANFLAIRSQVEPVLTYHDMAPYDHLRDSNDPPQSESMRQEDMTLVGLMYLSATTLATVLSTPVVLWRARKPGGVEDLSSLL